MTILAWLKLGALAVILGTGICYVWDYKSMKKEIVALKEENAGLQDGQRILKSEQEKFTAFMETASKARRKVQYVESKVDTIPDTAGDSLVLQLLEPYRVQPKGGLQSPGPGASGDIRHAPRTKAPAGPN